MTATRKLNIVTKQIILNDKERMNVRLIPVAADESDINEIQTHIDKVEVRYEALKKDVARFIELLDKPKNISSDDERSEQHFNEGLEYEYLKEKLSKGR